MLSMLTTLLLLSFLWNRLIYDEHFGFKVTICLEPVIKETCVIHQIVQNWQFYKIIGTYMY